LKGGFKPALQKGRTPSRNHEGGPSLRSPFESLSCPTPSVHVPK